MFFQSWSADKKLPKMFVSMHLMPPGTAEDAIKANEYLSLRAKSHASTLADKPSRYFLWNDQGLVLMIDQFGFSKQILNYESKEVVWDVSMPKAADEFEKIVSEAVELKERDLVTRLRFHAVMSDKNLSSIQEADRMKDFAQKGLPIEIDDRKPQQADEESAVNSLNDISDSEENGEVVEILARNFGSKNQVNSNIFVDQRHLGGGDKEDNSNSSIQGERQESCPVQTVTHFEGPSTSLDMPGARVFLKYILQNRKIIKITSAGQDDDIMLVEDLVSNAPIWVKGDDLTNLKAILADAEPIRPKLVDQMKTITLLVKLGDNLFHHEGSLRDYDNPSGLPEALIDAVTHKEIWNQFQPNAVDSYEALMRNSEILGTTTQILHKLFESNDKLLELHLGDDGKEKELVEFDSRAPFWSRTEDNAWDRFSDIIQDSEFVGYSLSSEFVPCPPVPEPIESVLNLVEWNFILKGDDRLIFIFSGTTLPDLGTNLRSATGFKRFKSSWQMKCSNEEERDDWYRHLKACKAWGESRSHERQKWISLAEEYKSMKETKAFAQRQEVIQVDENQLDAYKSKIVFLIDFDFALLHVSNLDFISMRKTKRLSQIAYFEKQFCKDLATALRMNEDKKQKSRICILSITNARQKRSWLEDMKAPLFYVNMARKCKTGGTRVEVGIDPDSEYMEAALNDPERAEFLAERDPACIKSSRELVEELLVMTESHDSVLYSGEISKSIHYAESRSVINVKEEDDDNGEIVGIPVWLELHFGNELRKTQVKGSQKSNFNELFRFFVSNDLGDSKIKIEVYTTTIFGKRLLGTAHISLVNLPSHKIVPLTLSIDENEHGLIVAQVKLTSRAFTMPLDELRRKNTVRAKLKTAFPFLTLRDRHQTESAVEEHKLNELKQVLKVEANVYLDYPCTYDGLDYLGRVVLRDLDQLGEQMADDVFSCIRAYGCLQESLNRPRDIATLERENLAFIRNSEASLCVGRNDILKSVQEYVHETSASLVPNKILVLFGQEGTGKSNILSYIRSMFYDGIRISQNANTGMLETKSLPSHSPSRRGHSWSEPEVIFLSLNLTLGGNDMRWFLYSLMSMLGEIFHGCIYPTFDSTNLSKNNELKLFPVPGEYNNLKLEFFNLCAVMDRLTPMKHVLVLIDDIELINPVLFDWLPMAIPTCMRLIFTFRYSTAVQNFISSCPTLNIYVITVPPLSVHARKELLRHSLLKDNKHLTMEDAAVLVLKEDACFPDYLFLSSKLVGSFDKLPSFVNKRVSEMESTMIGLSNQMIEDMEDMCGYQLVKHTLCLISTSLYGLSESELLVLLADVGMQDILKNRLTEEYASHNILALLNPQTPDDKRIGKQHTPNAKLPYALWALVRHYLIQHCFSSPKSMEFLFSMKLRRFVQAVDRRYDLDNPESQQGRTYFHRRLASYFRARSDPELQFSWKSDDFRAVQCLVYHMLHAKEWFLAPKVVTDLGFLELSVSLGNCYSLSLSLSSVLFHTDIRDHAMSDLQISGMMDINTFLTANVELLRVHPQLLMQTMANEPESSTVSKLAWNRALNGWEGRNWFQWVNRPMFSSNNIRTLHGHKGWVRSLALTNDRRYIISAADDRIAKFWICQSGALAHNLTGHRASITSIDISSSSRFVITASMDSSVKLWDIELQVVSM